jgi:hypothetical protein
MRYLMLSDIPEFLREQRGFRISQSTLQKLTSPACNQGPPVSSRWGRRVLFEPDAVLAWFDSRLRPENPTEAA